MVTLGGRLVADACRSMLALGLVDKIFRGHIQVQGACDRGRFRLISLDSQYKVLLYLLNQINVLSC